MGPQLPIAALRRYLYRGGLPWKPPLLKPGTVGHQNKDSCMNLFKKFLLDCLVGVLGHFGGSIWLPWNAFGLICALLGHLLASFGLSWGVFWSHFGSLGVSWNAFCAQVGPSSPKITKNTRFLNLTCGFGTQVGRTWFQTPPK